MRKTKAYCDRCGCEIQYRDYVYLGHREYRVKKIGKFEGLDFIIKDDDIDLCRECEKSFVKWLKDGRINKGIE